MNKGMRHKVLRNFLAAALCAPLAAFAQAFPSKSVRVIVPWRPGLKPASLLSPFAARSRTRCPMAVVSSPIGEAHPGAVVHVRRRPSMQSSSCPFENRIDDSEAAKRLRTRYNPRTA